MHYSDNFFQNLGPKYILVNANPRIHRIKQALKVIYFFNWNVNGITIAWDVDMFVKFQEIGCFFAEEVLGTN